MAKVWKHRLFSECCDSPCNCCYGTCLGPCAAASAKSQFDGSSWLYNIWWLCSPLPITGLWNYAVLRNYIRQGYEIDGDASDDCLTSTCCSPCVITQLLNEVSDRGPGVAPDADFIAKGNALNQVYAPNTHTDILMTYVCGYCEVASTYADAAGVPTWFSYLYPMSLCQLGHLTRKSGRIFWRGREYAAALNAKDDSEKIGMISQEDNETTPIELDVEADDCVVDCWAPWCAGVWPFYNCLVFYDTLYMIRRRHCALSDSQKFDNRYKDFTISSVPRPVNRPASTSGSVFGSPTAPAPRLAVTRSASAARGLQKATSFQSPKRVPQNSGPSFRSPRYGGYGVEPNEM